ncbi:MAG: GNAT family N-acetyltransferase [Cyanophyceae cyanobacterium]
MRIQIKSVNYTEELTAIATIRCRVFQEEQGVAPELEFDGQDETALHLLAYLDDQPVGTARIRALTEQQAKIERLAVLPQARGKGIAKKLMAKAIEIVSESNYDEALVHAQAYIKGLYHQLGFEQVGDPFIEANIPHIKMSKKLAS